MARIISICNAKGGVGKTTTAVNLGAYLATLGRRTLLVDFDPQANATIALGKLPQKDEKSVYHGTLGEISAHHIIRSSSVAQFDFIPSAPHLAGALIELVDRPQRELHLRRFLHHVRHRYDYIIIDLSPSMTLLTVNALTASDEVIIPVQAEYYGMEGLTQLLETIHLVQKNLGTFLKVSGALLTMFTPHEALHRRMADILRAQFPYYVFQTTIPRSSELAEAPSIAKPVVQFSDDSPGARAYESFARELLAQEKNPWLLYRDCRSPHFGEFNIQ